MAEYIEREVLKQQLKLEGDCGHVSTLADVLDIVDFVSTTDVAPVVHGRWDDSGRYTFPSGDTAVRCTNCGCALTEIEYHLNNWNYCPVCGAKMDGGKDDG